MSLFQKPELTVPRKSPVRLSTARISRVVLLCALFCCNDLTHAQAIEECKPVRTPGLSPAEVDRIALNKISESTKVPASEIDLTKSMKQIDRSDLGVIGYAVFLVGTSDQLGVDFAKASVGLVKEANAGGIYERTPIRDLLAIARSAYFADPDAPFPSARTGARYHGHLFSVAVPTPTEGWLLRRCATDEIVFVRPATETQGEIRAAVHGDRIGAVQRWYALPSTGSCGGREQLLPEPSWQDCQVGTRGSRGGEMRRCGGRSGATSEFKNSG